MAARGTIVLRTFLSGVLVVLIAVFWFRLVVACPTCHGAGFVPYKKGLEQECAPCDGLGKMSNWEKWRLGLH